MSSLISLIVGLVVAIVFVDTLSRRLLFASSEQGGTIVKLTGSWKKFEKQQQQQLSSGSFSQSIPQPGSKDIDLYY